MEKVKHSYNVKNKLVLVIYGILYNVRVVCKLKYALIIVCGMYACLYG